MQLFKKHAWPTWQNHMTPWWHSVTRNLRVAFCWVRISVTNLSTLLMVPQDGITAKCLNLKRQAALFRALACVFFSFILYAFYYFFFLSFFFFANHFCTFSFHDSVQPHPWHDEPPKREANPLLHFILFSAINSNQSCLLSFKATQFIIHSDDRGEPFSGRTALGKQTLLPVCQGRPNIEELEIHLLHY